MSDRPRVVITDYDFDTLEPEQRVLDAAGCEMIAQQCKTEQELIEACRDADALLVEYAKVTRPVVESLTRCKVVVRYGVGFDNLDVDAFTDRGIWACNVPDYSIDEVSDHAFALLMALGRKIVLLNQSVHSGQWNVAVAKPIFRLQNQTLGVLGYGRIGATLGRKAAGLGMQVLAHDPFLSDEQIAQRGAKGADFETVMRESDFVSVHSPLTPETYHLINDRTLALMRPTAYLINTSRGPLVDSEALARALKNGTIAGAGLDVLEKEPITPEHPLAGLDNCVLTPHAAYYSEESAVDLKTRAAEEVVRVLRGERPKNPLNNVSKT
ncbi:MAG: C-terminal binding protein [Chloroflexi bacterium]|nr:C-terminal binding protein [Chloroflexota bacterium]